MILRERSIDLELHEYAITPEHPRAQRVKVLLDGKEVSGCLAIILDTRIVRLKEYVP